MPGRTIKFIPEITKIYQEASDVFTKIISDAESELRESIVSNSCRYLFAKAVEGVILWGLSEQGRISVYFHPKQLTDEIETEVPKHLHKIVVESQSIGERLFKAHQGVVIQSQKKGMNLDLAKEIQQTIQWIPRLGVSYALFNNYHVLR